MKGEYSAQWVQSLKQLRLGWPLKQARFFHMERLAGNGSVLGACQAG
jgi:hypothetical protein